MSLHRLSKSKNLLSAIERLGKVLGYHVVLEHPLPTTGDTEPPAVDVAWFGAAGDPFPLMLFEVETVASNAMANNALKVFSQETAVFEKPLFFFHVIASGGSRSSRPQALERVFGTHNYRVYRLADGDGTQFVCDVLAQHRRIRSSIDFVRLFEACEHEDWGRSVNPVAVLHCGRGLGLSAPDYLAALVKLARSRPELLDELSATIEEPALSRWFKDGRFASYVGSSYGDGILFSLFLGLAQTADGQARWNTRLENWQRGEYAMSVIGPYFGLDQGYDEFLLGGGGALVALLVAAARRRGTSCETLCRALGSISAKLGPQRVAANVHVWTCHVAAALGLEDIYAIGQRHVDALQGLPPDFVVTPWPLIPEELHELEVPERMRIPELSAFRAMAAAAHGSNSSQPYEVALRAIDENEFVTRWSQPVLRCLWADH